MADELPAIGISFKAVPANDREIVFQTHVAQDVSKEELNGLLDRLADACERQGAKVALVQLRKELEKHEKHVRQMGEDLVRIDEKARDEWEKSSRRGPYTMSKTDAAAKAQATVTKARFEEEIDKIKEQIAEFEAKVK